jgi:signal transduction histidine kinase
VARSLRGRLTLALGLTAALSLATAAVITFGLVRRYNQDQAIADLHRVAEATAAEASGEEFAVDLARLRPLRRVAEATGNYFAVVGPRGRVGGGEPLGIAIGEAINVSSVLSGGTIDGTVTVSGSRYAYFVVPVQPKVRPAGVVRAVVLARRIGLTREAWVPILTRVLFAAGIAALVAVLAAALLARRLARPVRNVAEATARVASGDLEARVPVQGTDELAELGRSFNRMASALDEARRREGEFLSNVSHELRTPITAIRGYAEALDEGAVHDETGRAEAVRVIKTETARLERLVTDVTDLARVGTPAFRLAKSRADVGAVLEEAADAHRTEADAAGVLLDVAGARVECETDPGRVRQIVTNLLENAIRVTPRGGTIRLGVSAAPDWALIDVSDDGPGIPPEHLPHVFERSYLRNVTNGNAGGEGSLPSGLSPGSGLGLAIVRELVQALGGTIDVASEPGRGTTFRIALPR